MQKKILWWAYILMVASISLLMLIAVLLFMWHVESVTPWASMKAGDWGVWVGSLGTLGALAGTIYLATNQERQRERRERVAAELYAESILTRVKELMATTETLTEQLHVYKDSEANTKFTSWCVNHLLTLEAWEIEDISRIAPLSTSLAANMARASGMLKIIHAVYNPNLKTSYQDFSMDDTDLLINVLGKLNKYFNVIEEQLQKNRKYILRP
jgi:hypothetical protein